MAMAVSGQTVVAAGNVFNATQDAIVRTYNVSAESDFGRPRDFRQVPSAFKRLAFAWAGEWR